MGEESEGGGDEGKAGFDHHQDAVSANNTSGGELGAPGGDFGGELGEGESQVIDVAGAGAAAGDFKRGGVGLARGHGGEVAGDVGIVG